MWDNSLRERLILALDVDSKEDVKKLVLELRELVGFFKIGMRLFFGYGPEIVDLVKKMGGEVFLDAKLYDIPSVVEATCKTIGKMGVGMVTLHTLGGVEMMQRGAQAIKKENSKAKLLGVTLLTSFNEEILKKELGMREKVREKVLFLAQRAREAGLDGVICSGREIEVLREALGPDFILVVPGIRMGKVKGDEQKRVLTPEEAIKRGADYIVVGRPILQAPDPFKAVKQMGSDLDI